MTPHELMPVVLPDTTRMDWFVVEVQMVDGCRARSVFGSPLIRAEYVKNFGCLVVDAVSYTVDAPQCMSKSDVWEYVTQHSRLDEVKT